MFSKNHSYVFFYTSELPNGEFWEDFYGSIFPQRHHNCTTSTQIMATSSN